MEAWFKIVPEISETLKDLQQRFVVCNQDRLQIHYMPMDIWRKCWGSSVYSGSGTMKTTQYILKQSNLNENHTDSMYLLTTGKLWDKRTFIQSPDKTF